MAFDIRREAYSAFAGTRLLRMRLSLFLQKPCSAGRAEALPYGIIPYFPPCWPFTKGKQRPPCLKGAVAGARAGDWGIRSSPSEGGTSAKLTGEAESCRMLLSACSDPAFSLIRPSVRTGAPSPAGGRATGCRRPAPTVGRGAMASPARGGVAGACDGDGRVCSSPSGGRTAAAEGVPTREKRVTFQALL